MAEPLATTEGGCLDLSPPDTGHPSDQATDSSPEVILRHLLQMLYSHEDKQSAVAAALKAVMSLQQDEVRMACQLCCSQCLPLHAAILPYATPPAYHMTHPPVAARPCELSSIAPS